MARMIPEQEPSAIENGAERGIYQRIRDETPDTWFGLHHVTVPRHKTKPIAEIDFILISELGVFCLEVKGGAVARKGGTWWAGSRKLNESPFQQVGSAASELRHAIADLQGHIFGFGCAFPQCVFGDAGYEVDDEIVYSEKDSEEGFEAFVSRLADHWHSRYPYQKKLGASDMSRVLFALRPDFEFPKSMMPQIRGASDRLRVLTAEQADAVAGLRDEKQVIIRGGAGTGKTVIAVREAIRLAEAGISTLLTCYTKALAEYLRGVAIHENLVVVHFDGLISRLIEEGGTQDSIPADASDPDRFAIFRPLAAIDGARNLGESRNFDAIVIDEGQDLLTDGHLELFSELLKDGLREGVWRVMWDPNQAIFSGGASVSLAAVAEQSGSPVRYQLTRNCRNTNPIAKRVELLSSLRCEEIASTEGPPPDDRVWSEEIPQRRALRELVEDWQKAGLESDSIVILSPRKFEASVASEALGAKVKVEDRSGRTPATDPGVIPFSTIHAFKGLEGEAVILVDVDDIEKDWIRGLLYVGASRARTKLAVIRSEDTTEIFARRLVDQGQRHAGVEPSRFEVF